MEKLTSDQIQELNNIAFIEFKNLRTGQALMNALRQLNPTLYVQITATEFDPFYDDSIIPKFYEVIS